MTAHRLGALLVALAVVGVAAGPAAAGGATLDTVTITVHVVGPGGVDVADATVTATWDGGETSATTLSNGETLLDVPDDQRVELAIDHPDYTRNDPFVVDGAAETTYDVPVYDQATAEVTVLEDGEGVGGATVTMTKQGRSDPGVTGETDAYGVFTPEGPIEAGTYDVVAVKEGYLHTGTTTDVSGTTSVSLTIEQDVVAYEVTIVDDHFDEPKKVTGATIEYEGVTSGTIEVGGTASTTLPLQVNAAYDVTVTKEGYERVQKTVRVGEEGGSLQFAINREPSLSVTAGADEVLVGNTVEVTATDEYDERVANATVLVDGEAIGETGADGTYRATIGSAGEHTVTVEAGGVSGSATVAGVSADSDTDPTATRTATASTDGPEGTVVPLGEFDQPDVVLQIGVAAIGVLLAFLVVRRLL